MDLSCLRPVNPTPEIVISALSDWKKSGSVSAVKYVDQEAKKVNFILTFLSTLTSTPLFNELFKSLKPFTTQEDLKFGPELCGQDVFDQYMKDVSIAFRLINFVTKPSKSNVIVKDLVSYMGDASPENAVYKFLPWIIQVFDRANCWPYLPLPNPIPKIIFDNPFRKMLCSRRLHSVDPYLHIYSPAHGDSLQMKILDSCPLLDAPKAIIFLTNSYQEGKFLVSELPETLALPIGVPKETFMETCERCEAWKKLGKQNVIDAYRGAMQLVTYKLEAFTAMKGPEAITAAVTSSGLEKSAEAAFADMHDRELISATYYCIE